MAAQISLAQEILADPTTSRWLKNALQTALARDPVDALNDALVLTGLLQAIVRVLIEDQDVNWSCHSTPDGVLLVQDQKIRKMPQTSTPPRGELGGRIVVVAITSDLASIVEGPEVD